MNKVMDHNEARELLEAYALGILDDPERVAVEGHLATGCAECRAELRALTETVGALAETAPLAVPPPRLRAGILQRVAQEPPQAAPAASPRPIFPYVVAILGVAASLTLLIYSFSMRKEISRLRAELDSTRDVTSILESPGMKFLDLKGVAPNEQAFGKVVMDPKSGTALVYMYRLPQTPEGMQYQLWVMRNGKPTSAGVFTVTPDGNALLTLRELPENGSKPSFLVTIEPAGGKPAPTGMMYLTGPEAPAPNP